jgi:PKD domain/Beta-propeller repeat
MADPSPPAVQGRTLTSGFVAGVVASGLALTAIGTATDQSAHERHTRAAPAATHARVASVRSPFAFEPSAGRLPASLDYVAHAGGTQVAVGANRSVVALPGGAVTTTLAGARSARPLAEQRLAGIVNDFRAHDRRAVGMSTFGRVRYPGVYPGVDVLYHGRSGKLEYDFAVAPGADPSAIRLRVRGPHTGARLARNGDLVVRVGGHAVRQHRPVAFQSGARVAARFVRRGETFGIAVEAYDRQRALLIDPRIEFADFVGGSNSDELRVVRLDGNGNVYVLGDSRSPSFPGFNYTPAAGSPNALIAAKFSPTGTRLWMSYLGNFGASGFYQMHMAMDGSGNPVIAGDMIGGSIVTTPGAADTTPATAGYSGGWLGRLNGSSGTPVYMTYFSGTSSQNNIAGVAADRDGNAYIGGSTTQGSGFATTGDTSYSGFGDGYVAKWSPTGALTFATYAGGSGSDGVEGIGVSPSCTSNCAIFAVGGTDSTDFPTVSPDLSTPNPFFAMKLNSNGASAAWATYYSEDSDHDPTVDPSTYDVIKGMTVDPAGNPTVVGETTPTCNACVPDTAHRQAFIHAFEPAAGTRHYDYKFGGANVEDVKDLAIDPQNNIYVVGQTNSDPDPITFPMTGAFQSTRRGSYDAFVAKIDPTAGFGLGPFVFLTYLGGDGAETAWSVAPDGQGGTWVAGNTGSEDFPVVNPTQTYGQLGDGFIAKLQTAPVVIDGGPEGKLTSSTADFKFHSDEPNRSFTCRLSPVESTFTPCSYVTGKTYTGLADGDYTFEVRQTDAGDTPGGSASRAFTVALKPVAALTVAPNPVLVGRAVTFDATTSTAPNGIAKYEWDTDGDGTFERDTGNTSTTTQTYFVAGTINVGVRVTDNAGLTSTASTALRITEGGTAGTQFGVTINKGAQFTRTPNVTVNVKSPPNTSSFLFSNDGGFLAPAVFVPDDTVQWTLDSSGPERLPKTIYVRFLLGAITSQTYQDDIILDEVPPKVSDASVAPAAAASGATISRLKAWRVKVKARDSNSGVAKVQVTVDKRKPGRLLKYKTKFTIRSAKRPKFLRARDRAGNYSKWRKLR